jgi:hypothetical protein
VKTSSWIEKPPSGSRTYGWALAAACGWHFTKVSKIEHGSQEPSRADFRARCRACDAADEFADLMATLRSSRSAYVEYRQISCAGIRQLLGSHTLEQYGATPLSGSSGTT